MLGVLKVWMNNSNNKVILYFSGLYYNFPIRVVYDFTVTIVLRYEKSVCHKQITKLRQQLMSVLC